MHSRIDRSARQRGVGLTLALWLLLVGAAAVATAQPDSTSPAPDSWTAWFEANPEGLQGGVDGGASDRGPAKSSLGPLTFYTDEPTFDGDFPGLPIEDFEESPVPPAGVLGCDEPVDENSNDPCFAPGDILPGMAVRTFEGIRTGCPADCPLVVLGDGLLGQADVINGPNFFVDTLLLEVNQTSCAVGFHAHVPVAETFDVVVTTQSGTFPTTLAASPTGLFWGVATMGDPIVSVQLISPSGGGELVDNVRFGDAASCTMADVTATKVDIPGTPAMPGDTITYQIDIGNAGPDPATNVELDDTPDANTTIASPVTTTPLALDDGLYEGDPTTPTTVDGTLQPLLLDNDFGIPGTPTLAALPVVAQPTSLGGSVDINADGSFTYTPPPGATGGETDTFTYDVQNGIPPSSPATDTATASILLGLAPVAEDDALSVVQNTSTLLDAAADNGSGADDFGIPVGAVDLYGPVGGPLTTAPGNAFVSPVSGNTINFDVSGNGTFTYDATVNPTFAGNDTFEYQITNSVGSDTAVVTIEVQQAPVAEDDAFTVLQNTSTLLDAAADNGSGADDPGVPTAVVDLYGPVGGPLTTAPGNAFVSPISGNTINFDVSGNGMFTYDATVNPTFGGTDMFEYQLTNAVGSDTAVVTIEVQAAPVAQDDAFTVTQNASTLLDAAADNGSGADDFGVPVGAVDLYGPVGGPLTTAPGANFLTANGNTVNFDVSGNGMFTYDATVNPTFAGSDTFEYQVTNAVGSDTAVVTIEVQALPIAVDDGPLGNSVPGDAYHTALNTPLDSSLHATPPVLDNDDLGFPVAALVSYGTSASPTDETVPGAATATDQGGMVTVSADGNFVYTPPNPTFAGIDMFGYRIQNAAGFDDGVVSVGVGSRPVCDDEVDPDDYDALGNVGINVPAGSGVLIGDTGDGITVTGNTAPTSGGTATVAADGSFTYTNGGGFTGVDTFTYTVGNGFGDSAPCTVEVAVANTIWFIDNQAAGGGDGTLTTPYDSLMAYAIPALDGPGDIVFIDEGDGTSVDYDTGITLQNNQLLIGQGVDLATAAGVTLPPFSDPLPGVATSPTITNTAGDGVTLASGNLVTGLDVDNASGAAITGTNIAGSTVTGVGIDATGTEGLIFNNATGSIDVNGAAISGTTGIGIDIVGGSASFDFDSTSSVTNASGAAFRINGGSATVVFNGNLTQANNASLVSIINHATGSVTFQSGTLGATNGNGIQLSNADGSAYNFNGTTTLGGGDAGVDILAGSSGTFTFANTMITTPGNGAFNVDASSANVNYNGGSITQNSSATAYRSNGNSGGTQNIAVGITANTSTADGIVLTNNTGATIVFTGALDIDTTSGDGFVATGGGTVTNDPTDINTIVSTSGTAVNIQNTAIGAAGLTFQSVSSDGGATGIDIDGGGSAGFFTITGTGTTDGTGGTIQNTTQNGILIENTDNITLNNMDITNAADEAGGGCTSTSFGSCTASVEFNTVSDVTIDNMDVTGSDEHGLFGQSVTDLDISDSMFINLGNGTDENAIFIVNLLGTTAGGSASVWDNITVDNAGDNGVQINNSTSTNAGNTASPDRLTIQNSTIDDSGVGGIQAITDTAGTGNLRLDVDNTDFENNAAVGIATNANGGDLQANITGNMILHGTGNQFQGLSGVATSTGDLFFTVTGNTITANNGGAGVGPSGIAYSNTGSGNVNGTIGGAGALTNSITNNTPAGVTNVSGVSLINNGSGSTFVDLLNNTINVVGDGFGIIANTQGANTGSGHYNIHDNSATVSGTGFVNTAISLTNSSSSTASQCVDMTGNSTSTSPGANADVVLENSATGNFDVQQTAATNNPPFDFVPNSEQIELDIQAANTGPIDVIFNPFGSGGFGPGTCTAPSNP